MSVPTVSPRPKARTGLLRRMYKHRWAYILLIPVIAFFIIFHYVPMYGIVLAFKKYMIRLGIIGSPWIGLENFERLFGSAIFLRTIRNTVLISLYRIVFGFPMPILFALMLNEINHPRFKKTVQTISYLPHFISWVILGGILTEILSPTRGALNYLLQLLGFEPIHFMADAKYYRTILVVSGIWKEMGWSSIIYLAAIAGIPTEQYEAAAIDGASRLKCMWYITLPSILGVVSIQLIMSIGGILNGGFDQVFNTYNSLLYETGDIIDTYAYRVGLEGQMDYSLSTAISLFKNIIGFVLVIGTNWAAKKLSNGEGGIW